MTEPTPAQLRNRITHALSQITDMYTRLPAEALEHPDDREMPGGEALNLAAGVASPADWEAQFEAAEAAGEDTSYASLQVAQHHPLLVLGDWSERIRHERGETTTLRITITRSADYLRHTLDWAIEHFDPIAHMAAELGQVVALLEGVLAEGVRHDASAAACFKDIGTPAEPQTCGGRLVRRVLQRRECIHVSRAIDMSKGIADPVTVLRQTLLAFPEDELAHRACDQGGRDDIYRCTDCGGFFTEAEYWLCVKASYERNAG